MFEYGKKLRWHFATWVLLLMFLMQACSPKKEEACGFVQNSYGERVSWSHQSPVTFYLHESVPQEFEGAIASAMRTWEKSLGRKIFILSEQKIKGPAKPTQDGYNVIYFMKQWEADKSSEQARTNIYWIGDRIKEADIRINAQFSYYWNQPKPGTSYNIEALVLHEQGHVLGLKHNDSEPSVMDTYLSSHNDRVALSQTDMASLKCEY